jgi:DNA repair protein RadD
MSTLKDKYKELRMYQQKAVNDVLRHIDQDLFRIMVQAATGAGKTHMMGYMVRKYLEEGKRILITMPRIVLLDQTSRVLSHKFQIKKSQIGRIHGTADKELVRPDAPVQVASTQTLFRRKDTELFSYEYPEFDLVLIDEAHVWFAVFYEEWFQHPQWQKIPFIGFSATPWTRGMGKFYDKLIFAGLMKQLMDEGTLCSYSHWAPSKGRQPDFSNARTNEHGDYLNKDNRKIMSQRVILADIVDEWKKRAKGKRTILFAVDLPHTEKLKETFTEAGVSYDFVYAKTKAKERLKIQKRFINREVDILINVGVLTLGVDLPVECIIIACGTKSAIKYVQMIGRGMRTDDDNPEKILLLHDHGCNFQRLGAPEDIHYRHLCDGEPPAIRVPPTRQSWQCSNCYFVNHGQAICENCGFPKDPDNEVLTIYDELIKVGQLTDEEQKEQFFQGLRWIQEQSKWAYGWVGHHFHVRYGFYPTAAWKDKLPAKKSLEAQYWYERFTRDQRIENRKSRSK